MSPEEERAREEDARLWSGVVLMHQTYRRGQWAGLVVGMVLGATLMMAVLRLLGRC